MEKSYIPVRTRSNSTHSGGEASYRHPSHSRKYRLISYHVYAHLFLLCTNILTLIYKLPRIRTQTRIPEDFGGLHNYPWHGGDSLTSDVARVEPLPEIYTSFHWWTAYGSHNRTRDDQLWKAMNPSHGFVAIDRQTAADHHLPVGMYLPSDDSKRVYLLEAYYQLHCLVCAKASLRRHNAEKGLRKRYARLHRDRYPS